MATTLASPVRASSRAALLTLLFAGFILSGIATTIVGPLLPVFIRRWSLDDGQAGAFSMIQFLAALAGTGLSWLLAIVWGYRPALVMGYALIGVGLFAVNAASHVNALIATAAFGCGYGLITPGTNLFVAEIGGARRASLLNLLNFAWGAGAMACSPLVALALNHSALSGLLMSYAIFGAVLTISLLFAPFGDDKREDVQPGTAAKTSDAGLSVTIALAALFFIYVSTETSIGVWSAEYTRRLAGAISGMTTLAPMFFYAGLTSGRGFAPLALLRLREWRLVLGSLTLTILGILVLIESPTLRIAIAAVFVAGLGCACIYPIYIAWLSRWYGPRNKVVGGFLFAFASLGGSAGPRLIGMVSKYSGSLRTGLLVPLLSVAVMICILLALRRRTLQ